MSKYILTVLVLWVLWGCSKEPVAPPTESIVLNSENINLKIGGTFKLEAEIQPAEAAGNPVVMESLDPEIASVDADGTVRALKEGNTEITVSSGNIVKSCVVRVRPVYPIDYTVMIYGCAGGNLDDFIVSNLNQLKEYGSTEKVKATCLMKFSSTNTAVPNTVFYDLQGHELVEQAYADKNLDMGDPETLTSFINRSKELYPANHYVLVVTNHGSEWDAEYDVSTKAMVFDDNTNTALSVFGLAEGIRNSGEYFELVHPDVCLFGMLEFINELDDVCRYVISSSNLVLGAGGNYYDMLKRLDSGEEPQTCFENYVSDLMDYWVRSLAGDETAMDVALTVPSEIDAVYSPIRKFKDRLIEIRKDPFERGKYEKIQNCVYDLYFFDYLPGDKLTDQTDTDILDTFAKIAEAADDSVMRESVLELKDSFRKFVICEEDRYYEGYVDTPEGFSFGIQWSNFNAYNEKNFSIGYEQSKFDKAVRWSEFLSLE